MVGLVRSGAQAVEDVVGADEEQAGTGLFGGVGDVDGAARVDIERELAIALAAVHVGVGGSEDNPFRAGATDRAQYLGGVANVGVFRAEGGDLVLGPLF